MATKTGIDVDKLRKQLISFGKRKGHITQEELQELLPPDLVDPKDMASWEQMLRDEGVELLTATEAAKRGAGGSRAKAAMRKPLPDRADAKEDAVTSNDPIRMYLRKMGSIALLTREGEIEIIVIQAFRSRRQEQILAGRRRTALLGKRDTGRMRCRYEERQRGGQGERGFLEITPADRPVQLFGHRSPHWPDESIVLHRSLSPKCATGCKPQRCACFATDRGVPN